MLDFKISVWELYGYKEVPETGRKTTSLHFFSRASQSNPPEHWFKITGSLCSVHYPSYYYFLTRNRI